MSGNRLIDNKDKIKNNIQTKGIIVTDSVYTEYGLLRCKQWKKDVEDSPLKGWMVCCMGATLTIGLISIPFLLFIR